MQAPSFVRHPGASRDPWWVFGKCQNGFGLRRNDEVESCWRARPSGGLRRYTPASLLIVIQESRSDIRDPVPFCFNWPMALGSGLRRNDEIGSCWASQPPAGYAAARLTRPTRWHSSPFKGEVGRGWVARVLASDSTAHAATSNLFPPNPSSLNPPLEGEG